MYQYYNHTRITVIIKANTSREYNPRVLITEKVAPKLAMKVDTVLASAVMEQLADKLGKSVASVNEDQALNLVGHREDHVFVWNRGEQELLVASTGDEGEVQEMELAECPNFQVEGIEVSRTGLWVAVWGTEGVTAVEMPVRSGDGGRLGGGRDRIVCRTLKIVREGEGEVQSVVWHPGSVGESHLVVLTRDGRISMYNVLDGERLAQELKVGTGGKMATALGEAAVGLCFGGAGDDEGQWPLFVLYGNSDIFCVSASLGDAWTVEGPLEVMPQREDNYSEEACSVVVCGGVLALATVGGVIYHSVVLGGDTTSLHMYEMVELELAVVAANSEASSSVFQCPVRLSTDGRAGRYMASHRAGLHQVQLPMVAILREAEQSGTPPDLDKAVSLVEHLVCTRPTASSDPAPVLGACVAYPPTTVMCLLSNNHLTSLPLAPLAPAPPQIIAKDSESPLKDLKMSSFDAQLLSILSRSSTQPLLKSAPATHLSAADTLELLTSATATLRREYVARLQVAKEELSKRVVTLATRRVGQEDKLDLLEKERGKVRDKAELLSERYEDVRDKGQELGARVESVLTRLQSKIPHLSDKELGMAREVASLDRRVQALEGGVNQLREKEKYQRYQVEVGGRVGTKDGSDKRLDTIKEVLQRDSKSIADLVKEVNDVKKTLGM